MERSSAYSFVPGIYCQVFIPIRALPCRMEG